MQAIVLVGGEGTRLRPLTYALPKPMAPLLGRPFIGWIIERLRKAGVSDVILSCCYLPEMIEQHFGDGRSAGVKLHYVLEKEPLGTAGAIANAAALIKGPIYACNGDILTALDLVALRRFHERHGALATIHTRAVDDPSQFGVVETDAQRRVARFVEKPKPGESDARDINAGTYVLEREAIETIPAGRPVSIERETFPALIESTGRVFAVSTGDYWIDVGRPDSYVQAHKDMLDGKFETPVGRQASAQVWTAADSALPRDISVQGPVYVARGVRIGRNVRIEPYAVIYEDCVIEDGAVVGASILWPRCHVKAGATVREAILGLEVSVDAGVKVAAGAVVGRGERVPAGAIA